MPKHTTCLLTIFITSFYLSANTNQHRIDSIQARVNFFVTCDSINVALNCLMDLANEYEYNGLWEKYDSIVEIMFSYADETNNLGKMSECYNKVGISSCIRGKNNKALSYFKKGLVLSKQINDMDRMANFHENIGLVYKDMGDFEKALHHQTECLKQREQNPLHPRLPNSYSNISQLWEFLGDTAKQLEYLMKAVKIDSVLELDHSRSAILCCEVGEFLMDRKKNKDALEYFQKGLQHCEKIGWQKGIAVFKGDMAALYDLEGNWIKGKEMHRASLNNSILIDDCQGIVQEYSSIAHCFMMLNNNDSAQYYIKKGIEIANQSNQLPELRDAMKIASEIYEYNGQLHQALSYYKQYHTLNDSLVGIAKQISMNELETKYETSKKEHQIELLSTENQLKKQRHILFLVTIIILIMVIILGFLLYIRRKKINENKQEILKQKLLRLQMNPHFLFNALGSIQNYMLKNNTREASEYLSNFASLTRSVLEFSNVEKITLSNEIAYLNNYLILEQLRMNHSFDFEINYDKNLDTDFIEIPPMFIQPFVENAIIHGMKDLDEGGRIELCIEELEDQIIFTLKDNGNGIKKDTPCSHTSMALKIFKERKSLIDKKLKVPISYKILSPSIKIPKPHGTTVTINLPF